MSPTPGIVWSNSKFTNSGSNKTPLVIKLGSVYKGLYPTALNLSTKPLN
jgi:hypothetical protein